MRGTPKGYFPEATKSILVVYPWNFPRVEAFFWGYILQTVTGSCYLGGFVGTNEAQDQWLGEKV